MPKVILKVDRRVETRSTKPKEQRNHSEGEHAKSAASPLKSHSVPAKKGGSRQERSTTKVTERKFFTVSEDNTILTFFKEHQAKLSSRDIAEQIAKKVKHTVESVRDRIKRFLSRLRQVDEKYIAEVAKSNPNHYVHFSKMNDNKKRTVTFINETQPKVAGSTLKVSEKRALAREETRKKREKYGNLLGRSKSAKAEVQSTGQRVHAMTTEEMFRLRYAHEQKLKERSAGYSSKLRKREPKANEHQDPTEFLSPVIKQRDRNREFFRSRAERERQNKQELQTRVDSFIQQLGSKNQSDVEVNAHVLAEIMRSFSLTFGVGHEKIASLISQEEGGVNIEEIRRKIMAQGE